MQSLRRLSWILMLFFGMALMGQLIAAGYAYTVGVSIVTRNPVGGAFLVQSDPVRGALFAVGAALVTSPISLTFLFISEFVSWMVRIEMYSSATAREIYKQGKKGA